MYTLTVKWYCAPAATLAETAALEVTAEETTVVHVVAVDFT